mmetsp:Transcript_88846/g.287338  ORF Transcript_88846/g.287338 Transcript_88846/m.287338 type:complete len:237 (+) Transcript_88846:228-938(+)
MVFRWPSNAVKSSQLSACSPAIWPQTRSTQSTPAVAKRNPSGDQAAASTVPYCSPSSPVAHQVSSPACVCKSQMQYPSSPAVTTAAPLGDQDTACTGAACLDSMCAMYQPGEVMCGRQIEAVASALPISTCLLSGDQAAARTLSWWARRIATSSHCLGSTLEACQIRAARSSPAVSSERPEGDHATTQRGPLWPPNTPASSHCRMSAPLHCQTRAVLSPAPTAASLRPSGDQAIDR